MICWICGRSPDRVRDGDRKCTESGKIDAKSMRPTVLAINCFVKNYWIFSNITEPKFMAI